MELYIHIPFCVRKCEYCSFISFPAPEAQKEEYITALLQEAENRSAEFAEPVSTVYIGGGTPSLLSGEQFTRLLRGLRERICLDAVNEFTVEANPGTLSGGFLDAAVSQGVNRLSLGMQSADESLLWRLGRIHTFRDVEESVTAARQSGIGNLNLDLMFGIPGQTADSWKRTLEAALSLGPEHISAYGLIPEEGTPLFQRLEAKEYELPDVEDEREMYSFAIRILAENGLEQYEISNFARKGYECVHNIGYWTQIPYAGLGVAAASMRIAERNEKGLACVRRTNPEDFGLYLRAVRENDSRYAAVETVDRAGARFETLMLGLRMNRGVSGEHFRALHGVSLDDCYGPQLRAMRDRGLMAEADGRWFLTARGMDIQNSVLLEFMEDPS